MPDLSRLSDAERRALLLLAHGHTAKTAAVELGVSEGSINERLREARRKAGVGSSRQLARIVAAEAQAGKDKAAPQENRDRKIGMAAPATRGQGRRRDLTPWAVWPVIAGAMTMIALAASIGAFVALAVARQPAPPAPSGTVAVRAATPSPPRVVAVSPMPGAVVPAGRLALTVTFDQPMQAGWSFVARDPATYPACERTPRQSADRRSFTLACAVEAGREYEVGFNSDRPRNFASETGAPAIPAMVRFKAR
ncbi:sigma factor-like helix-turn-helix DNA-binding protein [Caulobacter radicis]|uniref:sigma factor-like helix-turn-helix DNA-binding protein n=1 Tax=Caulobacter radicis TaxID=2172650 RepID=UPI001A9C8567|nr:LuxR C-terminal-related transcriptional regulator [Caulobacter radicis]